jgi:hypothetical protein
MTKRTYLIITDDRDGPTPTWWDTQTEQPIEYATKRAALAERDAASGELVAAVERDGNVYLFVNLGVCYTLADLRRFAGRV